MTSERRTRKSVRLKGYDYGQNGIYFVTVCTADRRCILSEIVHPGDESPETVGRGLAPAVPRLTDCGQLVEEELALISARYPTVTVEKYVIMPNHFHGLICLNGETAGASPRPTLMQVVGVFKSLTTRRWNQKMGRSGPTLWQPGYYEHIIRDDNDLLFHWPYIDQNPGRWEEDEYRIM